MILAEMRNEVIRWRSLWLSETCLHNVAKSGLCRSGVYLGAFHIRVLTEVGDEIIFLEIRWFGADECSILTFGSSCVLKCLLNIPVLSKVWHKVISWWFCWSSE